MLRLCEPAETAAATLTSLDVICELVDVLEARLPLIPRSPDDEYRWAVDSLYYTLRGVRGTRRHHQPGADSDHTTQ